MFFSCEKSSYCIDFLWPEGALQGLLLIFNAATYSGRRLDTHARFCVYLLWSRSDGYTQQLLS